MKFSQEQILKLEQNVNVKAIINDKIHYTMEFKKKAIEEFLSGKSAKQIFIKAGFNLQNISTVPDNNKKNYICWIKTQVIILYI